MTIFDKASLVGATAAQQWLAALTCADRMVRKERSPYYRVDGLAHTACGLLFLLEDMAQGRGLSIGVHQKVSILDGYKDSCHRPIWHLVESVYSSYKNEKLSQQEVAVRIQNLLTSYQAFADMKVEVEAFLPKIKKILDRNPRIPAALGMIMSIEELAGYLEEVRVDRLLPIKEELECLIPAMIDSLLAA